jgi:hypothetical protein
MQKRRGQLRHREKRPAEAWNRTCAAASGSNRARSLAGKMGCDHRCGKRDTAICERNKTRPPVGRTRRVRLCGEQGSAASGKNGERPVLWGTGHDRRLGGGQAAGGGIERLGMMVWIGWEFLMWGWVESGHDQRIASYIGLSRL